MIIVINFYVALIVLKTELYLGVSVFSYFKCKKSPQISGYGTFNGVSEFRFMYCFFSLGIAVALTSRSIQTCG